MSFVCAFTLNFVPWDNRVVTFQPDFVLMLLLYWCTHLPGRVSIGTAFVCGIVMDIADANVFGQHALAYVLVTFLMLQLRRRMLMHSLWQQSVHVFGILFVAQLTMALTRLMGGSPFIGLGYFVAAFTGALLWPTLSHMLQAPQRLPTKARYEAGNAS
jgi:rod shape-determining protein MreD